jgi:F-box interacting protein
MRKKQKQEDEQEQEPLGSIPEGPLVEILSRVPYMSLCRFKCVSKPWLALCSDHQVRKRCPQTLAGFFYKNTRRFCNLSGRGPPMVDPSQPFLRKHYTSDFPGHCCGGLVLCKCWISLYSKYNEYDLVVCNPATEKWIELPHCPIESPHLAKQYLGFDPADPSRFVVYALHRREFTEVTIYSSDTGRWTTVQSGWAEGTSLPGLECVFLNGTMHLMTREPSVVTVDTEGKVWREIHMPENMTESYKDISIGQSQGRLYAWCIGNLNVCQLSVWALEDYASANWTLKHTVNILELFGRHCRKEDEFYKMFAIHPDRNLIFLTDQKEKIISYDMDSREVHVISTSGEFRDAQPYIPCFAELPSDGH